MRKQVPNPEDIELFRQQMGDVSPLTHNTVELPRPVSRRRLRMPARIAIDTSVSSSPDMVIISSEDVIQFRRSGIQDRVYRKLQRGQIPIVAELDLHGMTVFQAKIALDQFMEHLHHMQKQVCVRIIHGKGYGSKDGLPVIKRQTQQWLQCNINVLAYYSCRPSDGGTGAIYVLVKNSEKSTI